MGGAEGELPNEELVEDEEAALKGLAGLRTPFVSSPQVSSKKRTPLFQKPQMRKKVKASKPQFDATLTDDDINLVRTIVEEVSAEAV